MIAIAQLIAQPIANTITSACRVTRLLVLLLLCLALLPSLTQAAETLVNSSAQKKCLQYQKKIDQYQRMRQQGGSGAQMESWRKSRKKYKDLWQGANCHRGGNHPQNSLGGKTLGR